MLFSLLNQLGAYSKNFSADRASNLPEWYQEQFADVGEITGGKLKLHSERSVLLAFSTDLSKATPVMRKNETGNEPCEALHRRHSTGLQRLRNGREHFYYQRPERNRTA
jgi:hypothetical protein